MTCSSCGAAAYGRVRLTVCRASSDALPAEHAAHAGKSATRVLCRRCMRERCKLPYLAVTWLELVGEAESPLFARPA